MYKNQYYAKESYFEVTQLVNSLIGLLIFPEQAYYRSLEDSQLTMEKDLAALNRIICEKEYYYCSYKETGKVNLIEEQIKRFCDLRRRQEREEVIKEVFGNNLPFEKASPLTILRHMRNAVAHENIGVIPVSRNERITSVLFEDYGCAALRQEGGGFKASYIPPSNNKYYRNRQKFYYGNPLYGYFRIEIPVEELESVLIEISNAILITARRG